MSRLRRLLPLVALVGMALAGWAQENEECTIVVTRPAEGETWVVGQTYRIEWTSQGLCPAYFTKVELVGRTTSMGGQVVYTMANVSNNGLVYFYPSKEMLGYPQYVFRFWGVPAEGQGVERILGISKPFYIAKDNLPPLVVDPVRLRFVLPVGDHRRTETVYVKATRETVGWKAVPEKTWLTADPAQGTVQGDGEAQAVGITVSALTLGVGTYAASLTFRDAAGGEAATVAVEVTVVPAGEGDPLLEASVLRVDFTHRLEEPYPPQRITLSNVGTGSVGWVAEAGAPWLTISPSGGTLPPGASTAVTFLVARFFSAPGSHRTYARFKSSDGRVLTIRVSVNLIQPVASGAWPPSAKPRQTLPVAANAAGAYGSFWSTDATVLPAGRTAQAAHARFKLQALGAAEASLCTPAVLDRFRETLQEQAGDPDRGTTQFIWGALGAPKPRTAEAVITETSLPDNTPTLFLDVLGRYFGLTDASAFLQAVGDRAGDLLLVSRTYSTETDGNTYGQALAAPTPREIIGPEGGTAYVPGLRHEPPAGSAKGWRSNLFITELDGVATTVTARLYGANGRPVGTPLTRTLDPFSQWSIVNTAAAFGTAERWTYAAVTSGGGGSVVALGSVVDNTSNDPTTVNGFVAESPAGTQTLVLPAVVRVPGAYDTHWHSDIILLNASDTPAAFTLQFVPAAGDSAGVLEVPVTLPPFAMAVYQDIVSSLFQQESGAGALRLVGADSGTLLAFNRIYNLEADGSTYGQGTGAYTPADAIGLNDGTLYAVGLERSPQYRTNVGVVEIAGAPATLLFTVVAPTGESRAYLVSLASGQWLQADDILRNKAGFTADMANAWVMIDVVSGSGRVIGYASIIDNHSSDATYIKLPRR